MTSVSSATSQRAYHDANMAVFFLLVSWMDDAIQSGSRNALDSRESVRCKGAEKVHKYVNCFKVVSYRRVRICVCCRVTYTCIIFGKGMVLLICYFDVRRCFLLHVPLRHLHQIIHHVKSFSKSLFPADQFLKIWKSWKVLQTSLLL